MPIRKLILGSLLAATFGGFALPAAARTNVDVYVNFAPPPAYVEAVPAYRRGFVWIPGYWDWRAHRYHWVAGHWTRHRPGYVYYEPRWYDRNGRWHYVRGGWRRGDMDRDGIPNRYDRDRDGDGVPNRWDRAPNNPRYR